MCGVFFFSRPVGLLALSIQATSYLYFHGSSWLHTDIVFASSVALSIVSFAIVLSTEPSSKVWWFVGCIGFALACLSKSLLLGPYLICAPLIVFLVVDRRLRGLAAGVRKLKPIAGAIVIGIFVVPWYLWMAFEFGYDFFQEIFVEHHFDRLANAESHSRSTGYYLKYLPLDFLPWSLFIPLALFYGHAHFGRFGVKLCLVWFIVIFVTLSLISSKQGKYLLPVWTPLSLLVAAGLLETQRESLWETYLGPSLAKLYPFLLASSGVALVAGAALWMFDVVPESLKRNPSLTPLLEQSARYRTAAVAGVAGLALLVGAFWAWRAFGRSKLSLGLYWMCGAFAVVYLSSAFLYRDLNDVKSARAFCEKADTIIKNYPVAIYGTARPSVVYYLKRPLHTVFPELDPEGKHPERESELEAYLRAADQRFLLVFSDKWKDGRWEGRDLTRLEGNFPRFKNLYREVAREMVSSRHRYVVLTNKTREE